MNYREVMSQELLDLQKSPFMKYYLSRRMDFETKWFGEEKINKMFRTRTTPSRNL